MAQSQTALLAAFDAEAGDAATLVLTAAKMTWINDGQSRLEWYKPKTTTVSWSASAVTVALPSDFVQLDRLLPNAATVLPPWRVHGKNLVAGAAEAPAAGGGATVVYFADWPAITNVVDSELPRAGDVACVLYALSRFYRKIGADRSIYKRYATLVGQNAVPLSEVVQIADGYFDEFLVAKNDLAGVSLLLDGPRSTAEGDRSGVVSRDR